MLKYAVVGTGWIVQSFIDGTKYVPEFCLSAVYSRSYERGLELAQRNGIKTVFTSLEELAASDVDCVYIASPNSLHYSQSKKMLEAGKHVICEKPLTVIPDEAQELIALAQAKGLIYVEAIMYMYCPVRELLHSAIEEIGKVRSAHFDFSQFSSKYPAFMRGELPNIFNPKMATGSLMDLGVYCVYPTVELFGEPQNIVASSTFLSSGADGATSAVMTCGDVLVTLTCSKTGQDYAGSQIVGEKGTITIESISKLTGVTVRFNDGASKTLCGDTPKDVLMGNEARGFYELITNPKDSAERYNELNETALAVSRTMKRIRETAGIKFDKG
ncbi:MAG: Gfo/Idh/MocA family oxidoreductase [Clostridia bacterium]|nr:Gfo/Idh/MocA family oxidoreductase [Clostridia bacterium]